jgi:predicted PurR-regulated permease PerM
VLIVVIATGFILKTAQTILVPIALAILLAFLLHPLVKRLTRWGMNRIVSVVLVVGLASLLVSVVAFVVSSQIKALADDLPNHSQNITQRVLILKRFARSETIEKLQIMIDRVNHETTSLLQREEPQRQTSEPGAPDVTLDADSKVIVQPKGASPDDPAETKIAIEAAEEDSGPIPATPVVSSALDVLGSAGIVVLLIIFFLVQQADIRDRIVSVVGRGALATTTKALEDAGARISRYLLMQFVINATFGLAVAIGLFAIQIPYAAMWGLCAALFRYVPYIGPWVAALLPIATSLVIFPGWSQPLLVVTLFVILELVSNNVMEPILYGHSVGLSEIGIILSAIAWTWIWGPIGLVLATPMTVCLVVLGKYVPGLQIFDHLLGVRPPVGPPVRLYQRLLAKDEEEAEELIQAHLKDHSVVETSDEVLLPTIELVHQDRARDQIDDEDAERILTMLKNAVAELPAWSKVKADDVDAAAGDDERPFPLIVGIPAHSAEEELLLQVLAHAVADLPCRFEVLSADRLVSERLAELVELQPAAVCISALPPGDLAHARQLCKRIRSEHPDLKMFVGRWAPQAKPLREDQLTSAGADAVVTTFQQMHERLRSIAQLHQATGSTIERRSPLASEPALVAAES